MNAQATFTRAQSEFWQRSDAEIAATHITSVPTSIPANYVIEEIVEHLGAAMMQVTSKDDPIIIGHVKAAHALAKALWRAK